MKLIVNSKSVFLYETCEGEIVILNKFTKCNCCSNLYRCDDTYKVEMYFPAYDKQLVFVICTKFRFVGGCI